MKATQKQKKKPKYNMFQNSWFMIKLAWRQNEKKVIFTAILLALLGVALNLINLYIAPTILDVIENGAGLKELLTTIFIFVAALIFTYAFNSYVSANVLYGRISVRTTIVAMLNNKACRTSYPNIENEEFYKLTQQAVKHCSGNREATEAIWTTLTQLLMNILCFVFYTGLLFMVKPIMLIIILITTLIGFFINNYLSNYRYKHKDLEAEQYKKINYLNHVSKSIDFAKDIRIFGLRSWLTDLYDKSMDALQAYNHKVSRVYFWARVIDILLTFLKNAIAYIYLIGLVLNNEISIAEFLLYFSAVEGFSNLVTGVLSQFNLLKNQSVDLSIVRETLDYPEIFKFEDGKDLIIDSNKDYTIELKNVSFKYPGGDKNILTKINLTIHPKEKIAIVGLNGAGKTTLVKLICGYYDPTEGEILLNGTNIKTLNREHYYKMFSVVSQNFSLLAGSVATNVAQTEDNIHYELVYDCIEKAGLKQKIDTLPLKYETKLNREVYEDATNLSGGETQRLMLARALYKNAPIIVLDEPTSALDPLAEADIYNKYNELTKNKSSLFISHRLASTRFCDRILFIADEKIVEEGTHEELLALGGKYAQLFEIQSKYYKEGEIEDEK